VAHGRLRAIKARGPRFDSRQQPTHFFFTKAHYNFF